MGFRHTARSIARGHPVSGWVRNEPDGSVVMEVQGEEADVAAVLEALAERMAGLIRNQHAAPLPDAEGEVGFEIKR